MINTICNYYVLHAILARIEKTIFILCKIKDFCFEYLFVSVIYRSLIDIDLELVKRLRFLDLSDEVITNYYGMTELRLERELAQVRLALEY